MHINAFPPEILLNIFELGKATQPFDIGGSTLVFVISQTCATWRTITHTYPILWDDLRLTARSSPSKARNLLARYDGPSISVTVDRRTMPADPLTFWNVLCLVTAHAARFRALHFIGPAISLRLLSRACSHHKFSQLRDFVVVQSEEEPQPVRASLSINAPKLSSLSLTGTFPLVPGNYPWLRELRLDHSAYFVHFNQPVGVLEPQLLELQVLSIISSVLPLLLDPSLFPADSSIVSFVLCNLRERDVAPGSLSQFCRLVRMPLLEHLEVSGLTGYLWDEFAHSLRHSGSSRPKYPALKSVTFRSLSLTGITNADSLHAVQSVSELRLIDVNPHPLVEILEQDHRMCPKLRQIRLAGSQVLWLSSRLW
ncbi:hypothetical protein DFH07DRAFT_831205 [Mycena maculata]|uniref:F-box domain-containing protein n=1 Tax=Mycena maculata TaxID=230809 RepID=A0AAD7N718_9AGAR|nr:hypothetical protein DFH07DRAFT_831205 [Mycena maculata]